MSQDILKRNNVKVSGRGARPMLFAHGFRCEQNLWRFVAPAFEEDYRVVLFDYIGSGKSDLRAYDLERHSTRLSTAAGSSAPTSRGCSNSWSGTTSAGPTSSRPP